MFDDDVKSYTDCFKTKARPFVVLGTCNPYFSKVR